MSGSNKAFIILPPKPQAKKAVVITPALSSTATPANVKPTPVGSKPVQQTGGAVGKDQNNKTKPADTSNQKVDNAKSGNKDNKKDKKNIKETTTAPVVNADPYGFAEFNKDKKKAAVVWWKSYDAKSHNTLLLDPEQAWFEQYSEFTKDGNKGKHNFHASFDASKLKEVEGLVADVYDHQVSLYRGELAKLGVSSDQKWLNSVIDSGTWSDKIAAMALKVQESPLYNLEALDLLIGIATKKDLRTGYMAIEAIKDLLLNNLLPDRVLVEFGKTPYFNHEEMNMKCAMLNWFEHQLRKRVVQVLEVLETGLKSNIFFFRRQGLELAVDMLTKKPEQESKILSMIVNKLGDAEGRVSSKTSELLKQLLNQHPAMKSVVIREVRMFIYRSNIKLSAIFTAVNFLTQIKLGDGDSAVALQLAECFLSLFEKALQAKEEGSRLLTVLLNGINKSFPYLEDIGPLTKYLDSIFRLVHTAGSFATSIQALVLISSIVFASTKNTSSGNETEESIAIRNRFYITLYSKLLSDDAITKTKNSTFLNLLYRSVKNDPSIPRAKAFLKRIAICSTETGAAVTAGLLFMTSEILANRPELKSMLTAAELAEVEANLKAGHRDSDDEDDGDDNHSIANESTMTVAEHHMIGCYDAAKRNPLFACSTGLSPSLYELALLKHHYHPSTQAFAAALLQAPEHGISFSGDPLLEFNTMAFLNRFAYKNPKQNIAQNLKDKSKNQEEPVNLVFTQGDVDESKIAPEKHFFYKFFGERESLRAMGKSKDKKKKRQDDEFDSDDEDASVDIEGREEGEELNEEEEIDRFADKLAEDMMKHDAATRGDDYGDFSEDEEDDDEEFTSEPEDADDDNEEDDNKDQSLKKRKKASESTAFDFEEFLAEQGRQRAKKQKTVVQDDEEDEDIDDEDEEDEEEPEMYMDSDDEVSDDGEEGEFPAFLDDDDVDEDELMEEEVPQKDSKSKKGKKKAKRDDDNDDDDNAFADAADYEDQMDEIVNAYKYESTAAKISKAMFKKDAAKEPVVEEKSSKKGSVKFAADVKPPAADKKQKNKKSRR